MTRTENYTNEESAKSWFPEVLVVSGGGFKGVGFVGALKALYDKNIKIEDIKVLCGSSIGSLICLGIVLDYTIDEMKDLFYKIYELAPEIFPVFFDKDAPTKMLPLLMSQFSVSDGKKMDETLQDLFVKKEINHNNLTFRELRKRTKKDLVVVGSNITTGQPEYFSYRHTPNMLVYEAIRISSRLPFALPVIRLNKNIYVDGDILNSFPIDGAKKKIVKKARKGDMIGIIISSPKKSHQIDDLYDYLTQLLQGVMSRYCKLTSARYNKYVIKIPCPNSYGSGIRVSREDLDQYYLLGYQVGVEYINKRGQPTVITPSDGRREALRFSESVTPIRNYEPQTTLSEVPDQPDTAEHQQR